MDYDLLREAAYAESGSNGDSPRDEDTHVDYRVIQVSNKC